MEDSALDYQAKLRSLKSDVRDWGVYNFLKTEVAKFRDTMPLIFDLQADAMRDRHWKELRFEVKDDFDEKSDEFNLEKVFSLNLLNHAAKI